MESPTETKNTRKANIMLAFLFIIFAASGVAYHYWPAAPVLTPKPAIAMQQVIQPPATIVAPSAPTKAKTPPHKRIRIQKAVTIDTSDIGKEISLLNAVGAIPFQTAFISGTTSPTTLTSYLTRNESGYMLDMHKASFLTTPAYYDSCLYVSGGFSSREFYSFNAFSGKMMWATALSDDGPSSALVSDSLVIFNTESCTIFALDRHTGKQLWSKWIGDPLLTHPVSDGRLVYTAYPGMGLGALAPQAKEMKYLKPSHAIAALDAHTGDVKWQRWLDGDIMTTAVISGDDIFLTTFAGTIYRLAKSDGTILTAAKVQSTSLPTIHGDKIYTTCRADREGKIYESITELDRNSLKVLRTMYTHEAPYMDYQTQRGSELKKNSTSLDQRNGFGATPEMCGWQAASRLIGQSNVSSLQNFVGSTVVVDGTNLYSCMGDELVSVNIATDSVQWKYHVPGNISSSGGHLATMPMLTDKMLISVSLNGDVLLIDKQKGEVVKKYATHTEVRNQPILVNGQIFVPTTNGQLVCVNTGQPHLNGWSMFMKNNAHNCDL